MRRKRIQILALALMGGFVVLGAALGARALVGGQVDRALLGFAAVLFLLIPPVVGRLCGGHPWRLYGVLFAFCILAYDIGCVAQAFDAWPYFDKIAHFLSGIVFTCLGFCVYGYLARPRELSSRFLVSCTYALFFSVFVAVVWEIGEFAGFLLTGHDSQHTLDTGVFDTMEDLISCASFLLTALKGRRLLTGAVAEEFFQLHRR